MKFKIIALALIILSGCAIPERTIVLDKVREERQGIIEEESTRLIDEELLKKEADLRKELKYHQKLADNLPNRWDNYYNIGIIQTKLNEPEKAEEVLFEALKHNAPPTKIYEALGTLYMTTDNNTKAIRAFERALSTKQSMIAMINLANTYQRMDRIDEMFEYYKKAENLFPSNRALRYNLGVLNYSMGKYQNALEEFDKIEGYDAVVGAGKILQSRAQTLLKLGDYEAALKAFQKKVNMYPADPTPYRNIGIIYEIYLNDSEKALENYNAYIARGKEGDEEVKGWIGVVKAKLAVKEKR